MFVPVSTRMFTVLDRAIRAMHEGSNFEVQTGIESESMI